MGLCDSEIAPLVISQALHYRFQHHVCESPLVMEPREGRFSVELARVLAVTIRSGVQENWRQLRAIEEQIDTMTEEYDGEDVLHERMRRYLDEAKATLVDLHGELQTYTGPFELPEPDDDLRETIQRIIDNEVRHLPLR